jgi:hypothetical protein
MLHSYVSKIFASTRPVNANFCNKLAAALDLPLE